MRMLGEMATANPSTGSFADYARRAMGGWAGFSVGWLYWYFWVDRGRLRGRRRGQDPHLLARRPAVAAVPGPDGPDDRDQPVLGRPPSASSSSGSPGSRSPRSACSSSLGRPVRARPAGRGQSLDFSNLTAHGGFFPHGVGADLRRHRRGDLLHGRRRDRHHRRRRVRGPRAGHRQGHQLRGRADRHLLRRVDVPAGGHPALELHPARGLAVRQLRSRPWASPAPPT